MHLTSGISRSVTSAHYVLAQVQLTELLCMLLAGLYEFLRVLTVGKSERASSHQQFVVTRCSSTRSVQLYLVRCMPYT